MLALAMMRTFYSLGRWAIILGLLLMFLFAAVLPVFYFALYRNRATVRFSIRLRNLALATILVAAVLTIEESFEWIRSWSTYSAMIKLPDWTTGLSGLLALIRDPRVIGNISNVLGLFSRIAYLLLLVAMIRHASDPVDARHGTSQFLTRVTKVAYVAWGLVLIAVCIGLVLTPISFIQLRSLALQYGRQPPELGELLLEKVRMLLDQATLFAVPYIIYKSQREKSANEPAE